MGIKENITTYLKNNELSIEKAEEEALKRGKLEGKLEGETQTKIEIAKESIKKGLSLELISQITGIELSEVIKIKESMQ